MFPPMLFSCLKYIICLLTLTCHPELFFSLYLCFFNFTLFTFLILPLASRIQSSLADTQITPYAKEKVMVKDGKHTTLQYAVHSTKYPTQNIKIDHNKRNYERYG